MAFYLKINLILRSYGIIKIQRWDSSVGILWKICPTAEKKTFFRNFRPFFWIRNRRRKGMSFFTRCGPANFWSIPIKKANTARSISGKRRHWIYRNFEIRRQYPWLANPTGRWCNPFVLLSLSRLQTGKFIGREIRRLCSETAYRGKAADSA